jgi:hypothetical protein
VTAVSTSTSQTAQDGVSLSDRLLLEQPPLQQNYRLVRSQLRLWYQRISPRVLVIAIVDVSVIPYIREKDIVVYSSTVRPVTTFFPFFDGVNLLAYWMNPTLLKLAAAPSSRFYANTLSETLTSNTGGSGLIVAAPQMASVYSNTAWNTITVVNDNGLFSANNLVTGSIGSATATITEVIKLTDNVALATANTMEIKLATTAPSYNVFNVSLINSVINIPKGNVQVRLEQLPDTMYQQELSHWIPL